MNPNSSDRPVQSFVLGRWAYLRVLGSVFAFAFASLWSQAPGLVGPTGIRPTTLSPDTFEWGRLLAHPSLFWFGASDAALQFAVAAGFASSILLLLNVWPRINCVACYAIYLSFAAAEPDVATLRFFAWPPDLMLLEAAVWGWLIAPPGRRPGLAASHSPSRIALLGLWFFFFRMMFPSGLVKILHGQPHWLDLSVLEYHLVTLPGPATLGWFAVNLAPAWCFHVGAAATLAFEIALPFAILFRGWPRRWAGIVTIGFMVAIQLTGNYRWINLITICVAFSLIDDGSRLFRRFAPTTHGRPRRAGFGRRCRSLLITAVTLFISIVGAAELLDDFWYRDPQTKAARLNPPGLAMPLRRVASVARVGATHKLFHGVALDRKTIVIEGSDDGVDWRTYQTFAVPAKLDVAPTHFAPLHRYLDFGLWGAATAPWVAVRDWYDALIKRLLEGSPAVERLFAHVPFRDAPPRFIRSSWWIYRYTTPSRRAASGRWWERYPAPTASLRPTQAVLTADWSTTTSPLTLYTPIATLDRNGALAIARLPARSPWVATSP